jgi:hypothetical protein
MSGVNETPSQAGRSMRFASVGSFPIACPISFRPIAHQKARPWGIPVNSRQR